jgi:hypothetical protein
MKLVNLTNFIVEKGAKAQLKIMLNYIMFGKPNFYLPSPLK